LEDLGVTRAEPSEPVRLDSEPVSIEPESADFDLPPLPDDDEPKVAPIELLAPIDGLSETPDVLSEADIYLAYGRHAEAERLLRGELERDPGRHDVLYKLADAYFNRADLDALRDLADSARASGADRADPGQWQRFEERLGQLEAASGERSLNEAPPSLAAAPDAAPDDILDLNLDSLIENAPPGGVDDIPLLFDDSDLLLEAAPAAQAPSAPRSPSVSVTQSGDKPATTTDELSLSLSDLDGLDHDDFRPTQPLPGPLPSLSTSAESPEPEPLLAPDSEDVGASGIRDGAASELLLSQWETDSGLWDENSTKLDLAQAYVDMGDKDAARGILEEVMADGSEEQRAKAKSMLATLD